MFANRRAWAMLFVAVAVCLVVVPAARAGKKDGDKGGKVNPYKLMIKDKLPPVTDEERAMTGVAYAPGAPAAILLDAEQQEFYKRVTEVADTRTIRFRRIKLFDDAAADPWGQWTERYSEKTKIESVTARTTLPDGTEIDASDGIKVDETVNGSKLVSVSFPRASAGSILDVLVITNLEAILVSQWQLQQEIPVLDSRFIFAPPNDLQFTLGAMNISDPKMLEPHQVKSAKGSAYVWQFTDLAPIPDEPNQPPTTDTAQALYVLPTAFHGPGYHLDFASDWAAWSKDQGQAWNLWIDGTKMQTRKLAEEAAAGLTTVRDRADAVRRAALARVRVDYHSDRPRHAMPDAVLAAGSGSSADLAGLNVAMLRELGLDAHVLAYRHRGNGRIPDNFPVEVLFDDLLVRVRGGGEEWLYSPTAQIPVGMLPEHAAGVLAMPADRESSAPVSTPELTASQNSVNCVANLELARDGALTGTTLQAYRGTAADRWRQRLRFASEDERRERVQRALATWVPGIAVESLEIDNLEDDGATLTLRTTLRADGYATAAGSRLLVNPVMFSRVRADEWSAPSRATPIDLGGPIDVSEVINLKLPEGVADVETPSGAKLDAGAIGGYELTYKANASFVSAKRKLRLNTYRFPAAAWTDLARLFRDMASADDTPVVVSLGPS